jgi:hypothetical protein
MAGHDPQVSACRHCKNYRPEGRRGGHCDRFNAFVQGHWESCSLAIPTFSPLLKVEPLVIVEALIPEPLLVEPLLTESVVIVEPILSSEPVLLTARESIEDNRIVA